MLQYPSVSLALIGRKATPQPDGFGDRDDEPVPPPQIPSTPPRRQDVQAATSNLGDHPHVDIRLSSWILDFSEITINISPRRGIAQANNSPIITRHHEDTSAANPQTSPPSPRPGPSNRPLRQSRSQTSTATRTSFPTQPSQVYAAPIQSRSPHQHPTYPLQQGVPASPQRSLPTQPSQVFTAPTPRPIYPLQPGEPAPRVRIFRDDRAHGYYVIFKGPCLGIYHEYWFVCFSIIRVNSVLIYVHRSDILPYLRKDQGGSFRKGKSFEDAKALWNDPYFTKRVID